MTSFFFFSLKWAQVWFHACLSHTCSIVQTGTSRLKPHSVQIFMTVQSLSLSSNAIIKVASIVWLRKTHRTKQTGYSLKISWSRAHTDKTWWQSIHLYDKHGTVVTHSISILGYCIYDIYAFSIIHYAFSINVIQSHIHFVNYPLCQSPLQQLRDKLPSIPK